MRAATAALAIVVGLFCSCSKSSDNPAGTKEAIYFTIDGFYITVHNLWNSGGDYRTNTEGLVSYDESVSREGETHTMKWRNIVKEIYRVSKFDVTIDGIDYRYPAVSRGDLADGTIRFTLNDTAYVYTASEYSSGRPYAYHVDSSATSREIYVVAGGATVDDCKARKNCVSILFLHEVYATWDNWWLSVDIYNGSGVRSHVVCGQVSMFDVYNEEFLGAQMWASLDGPYIDTPGTLKNLAFSVERIR